MGVNGDGRKMMGKDPPPADRDAGAVEWHRKYRPRKLSDVLGQEAALKPIGQMVKDGTLPQAVILSGPSGVGKTTVARILRSRLGCDPSDFFDINAADSRGIDTVREVRKMVPLHPRGECRIWLIDEAHKLTDDAQTAMLKLLEDCPRHARFILATTHPEKLIPTVRGRCPAFKLGPVPAALVARLVKEVAAAEGVKPPLTDAVVDAIVEAADGSPRQALRDLQMAASMKSECDRLAAVVPRERKRDAFELAKLLIWGHRPTWKQCCELIQKIDVQRADAEGFRWLVMACARKELLKGNPKTSERAYAVLDAFSDAFFNTGEHGVVLACYRLFR